MPRKKPLDFGGNPDHVTLRLGVLIGLGAMVRSVEDVFDENLKHTCSSNLIL